MHRQVSACRLPCKPSSCTYGEVRQDQTRLRSGSNVVQSSHCCSCSCSSVRIGLHCCPSGVSSDLDALPRRCRNLACKAIYRHSPVCARRSKPDSKSKLRHSQGTYRSGGETFVASSHVLAHSMQAIARMSNKCPAVSWGHQRGARVDACLLSLISERGECAATVPALLNVPDNQQGVLRLLVLNSLKSVQHERAQ